MKPKNHSSPSELNSLAYETEPALNEYEGRCGFSSIEHRLVRRFFDTREVVIDLGCGAGRTSGALVDAGFQVVGVDLSRTLLNAARSSYPGMYLCRADVRRLPFKDSCFAQALFSFNGLDYVFPGEDYLRALVEVRRILRTGGIFVYSGHNIIGRFGRHLKSFRELVRVGLREHPRFLWSQLRGSYPLDWYWRYPEPFGDLVSFSAPPPVHRSLQGKAGFETVEVTGPNNEKSERWLTWREHHIHYVLKKR